MGVPPLVIVALINEWYLDNLVRLDKPIEAKYSTTRMRRTKLLTNRNAALINAIFVD